MVSLIRNMQSNVLKSNRDLYFTVLTGCCWDFCRARAAG